MQVRIRCLAFCLSLSVSFAVSGQIVLTPEQYDDYQRREAWRRANDARMAKIYKELDEAKAAKIQAETTTEMNAAVRLYEAAKMRYDNKLKQAATSVYQKRVYAEVTFIYFPFQPDGNRNGTGAKDITYQARRLDEVKLLTGYLLSVKNGNEFIVAVEGQQPTASNSNWNLYTVYWNNNVNWGNLRNNYQLDLDVDNRLSKSASIDQKLKYIEDQITREQDRRISDVVNREKRAEEERKQKEAWNESVVRGKKYMREREPYNLFMFIDVPTGIDYIGEKLVVKGYTPGPAENFVVFFHVPDYKSWNDPDASTPLSGKVYKIASDKPDYYSITEVLTYYGLGVPSDIQYHLKNDPYISKIVERLVYTKLALISAEEVTQLKLKENDYFQKYRIKREEESNRKVAAESKFVYRSGNNYLGDEFQSLMTGIGVNTDYSNFCGVFLGGEKNFGVSYNNSNTIIRSYRAPTVLAPRMDITVTKSETTCVIKYDRPENPYVRLIIYPNGDVYYGDPPGNELPTGVKYLANGDMYSGWFNKSQSQGFGRYFYANGGMYDGQFTQGAKHGKGIEVNIDGDMKEVVYENGKIKDKSRKNVNDAHPDIKYTTRRYPSNDFFMGLGLSNNGAFKGIIQMTTGDTLYGVFERGAFYGLIRRRGGIRLYGEFKFKLDSVSAEKIIPQNSPLNWNFIIYPDGNLYNGYMSSALTKDGAGVFYYTSGEVYIGNFTHDQRNDNWGVLTYPNKNIFRGRFVNDKINGFGEYIDYGKAERYLGNFKDGKRDGEGTLFYTDGSFRKATYINGILQ